MGDPLKERVHIFGVGEEGILSMTLKAMRLLQDAEWIFGPERLLAFFPNHDAKKIPIGSNFKEIARTIQSNLGRRQMAVLDSGDPNFSGIAQGLVEQLGKDSVEIIPNVSAMQLAFARIKESWEGAYLGSVQGRPLQDVVEPVRHAVKVGILTDEQNTPSALATLLLERGVDHRTAYVCENLGGPDARVTGLDLEQLPGRRFSPSAVVILLKRPAREPTWPTADRRPDRTPPSPKGDEEGRI